jgi:hypothetical protein
MLRIASFNLGDNSIEQLDNASLMEVNPHVIALQNVKVEASTSSLEDLLSPSNGNYSSYFQGITNQDGTSGGNAVISKLPMDTNSFFEKLDTVKNGITSLVTKTRFARPESSFFLYNSTLSSQAIDQNAMQDLTDFISVDESAIFTWNINTANNTLHDLLRLNGFVHLHPIILSGKNSTNASDLAFWVTEDLVDKVNKVETIGSRLYGSLLEINIK